MIRALAYVVLLLAFAGVGPGALLACAQQPVPTAAQPGAGPAQNRGVVFLDPAHGGPDGGALLGDQVQEKELTWAIVAQLRTSLANAGFTILATRDSNSADVVSGDQRAEMANRAHALACIVLHATAIRSGIHIYTSSLQPSQPEEYSTTQSSPTVAAVPWDRAQAAFLGQSRRLANDVRAALAGGGLPAVIAKAPVKPLDNLMCPAVAIELAPQPSAGSRTPTDADYQQRAVNAITSALKTWRSHSEMAPASSPTPQGTP